MTIPFASTEPQDRLLVESGMQTRAESHLPTMIIRHPGLIFHDNCKKENNFRSTKPRWKNPVSVRLSVELQLLFSPISRTVQLLV